jgi:hypothetical protein
MKLPRRLSRCTSATASDVAAAAGIHREHHSTAPNARRMHGHHNLWGARAGMARLHVCGMQIDPCVFIRRVTARYRSKGYNGSNSHPKAGLSWRMAYPYSRHPHPCLECCRTLLKSTPVRWVLDSVRKRVLESGLRLRPRSTEPAPSPGGVNRRRLRPPLSSSNCKSGESRCGQWCSGARPPIRSSRWWRLGRAGRRPIPFRVPEKGAWRPAARRACRGAGSRVECSGVGALGLTTFRGLMLEFSLVQTRKYRR